jgi:Sec-independent protein translocase protein TatA
VGFGTEILFMLVLGLLVVGPRRLCAMLGHMARAKAELENATRGIKSQLAAQLDAAPMATETDSSQESVGDCEPCPTPESARQSRKPAQPPLLPTAES